MKFKLASAALAFLCLTLPVYSQSNPRAEELYKRTDYRASLALLDKNSGNSAINNLIGRNYYMLGDFKKSAEYFQKSVDAEPNNSNYVLWLGRAWGRRAETSNPLFAPGYASKTRQYFERAVELNPRNEEAMNDLFDYYLNAPGFLGGGMDKANALAEKISKTNPAEGHYALAQLAEKSKEYNVAEQQLRRAIDVAPRQVGRVLDLAKFLAKRGRTKESDEALQQAEKLAPNSPKVWFTKADVYIKTNRNLNEAKQLLQKYIQSPISPDDPPKEKAARLLQQVAGA